MQQCLIKFEELISLENLCEAWLEFIVGKRNRKDVQEFQLRLGDEIIGLHQSLAADEYRHGSYQEFSINDPKPRIIHKASVRDRLLHHAIHRKLYPFFAGTFVHDSFSCQNGKGLHRALRRFRRIAGKASRNHTRTCWVLKCDIRKFFASIDHEILLNLLHHRIADGRVGGLLSRVIGSFHAHLGEGLPLGNLTSQLFSNVYMDFFDKFVKHDLRWKWYMRYADDFIFLSEDRRALEKVLPRIGRFLSERLALRLHPDKVVIKTIASGIDFLGWIHFPHHAVLRTKTRKRMIKRVHTLPRNETLQSYLGMLKHGDAFEWECQLKNDYWLYRDS